MSGDTGLAGPAAITFDDVHAVVAGRPLLAGITAHIAAGRVCALIGPNGSGKTTLLRTLYRSLRPSAGTVRVDDENVWGMSARDAARRIGTVLQQGVSAFSFSVAETVAMGLDATASAGPFSRVSGARRAAAVAALREYDLVERADDPLEALSGGERQRVFFARALVGEPRLLAFDEPTNHLDPVHRFELFDRIRESGLTSLVSLHDLDLALRCDEVMVLAAGALVAHGPARETLSAELVEEVFRVRVLVRDEPVPHLVELGRADDAVGVAGAHGPQGSPRRAE